MQWINGEEVMSHAGGHLPFEAEATQFLDFKNVNRVTVAINNTLTPITLPTGAIEYKNDKNM